MEKKKSIQWSGKVYLRILMWVCGMLVMIPGKAASADALSFDGLRFSNTPGSLWMEVAVIIIVGLMVIFAIAAICFLHYQKKQDAEAQMQREEAKREEQTRG